MKRLLFFMLFNNTPKNIDLDSINTVQAPMLPRQPILSSILLLPGQIDPRHSSRLTYP